MFTTLDEDRSVHAQFQQHYDAVSAELDAENRARVNVCLAVLLAMKDHVALSTAEQILGTAAGAIRECHLAAEEPNLPFMKAVGWCRSELDECRRTGEDVRAVIDAVVDELRPFGGSE